MPMPAGLKAFMEKKKSKKPAKKKGKGVKALTDKAVKAGREKMM